MDAAVAAVRQLGSTEAASSPMSPSLTLSSVCQAVLEAVQASSPSAEDGLSSPLRQWKSPSSPSSRSMKGSGDAPDATPDAAPLSRPSSGSDSLPSAGAAGSSRQRSHTFGVGSLASEFPPSPGAPTLDTTPSVALRLTPSAQRLFARLALPTVPDVETLPDPITDVGVIGKGDAVPEGYTKIAVSVGGGIEANLNKGTGGRPLYLCVARGSGMPVIGLTVLFVNKGEFVPPGFHPVQHLVTKVPADLNTGTGGHELYLCQFRGSGSALLDIGVHYPEDVSKPAQGIEAVPPGFQLIHRTPLGHDANLNGSTRGKPIQLCFQKDLSHVQALFPASVDSLSAGLAAALKPGSRTPAVTAHRRLSLHEPSVKRATSAAKLNGTPPVAGGAEGARTPSPPEPPSGVDVNGDPTSPSSFAETVAHDSIAPDAGPLLSPVRDRPEAAELPRWHWILDGASVHPPPSASTTLLGTVLMGLYHADHKVAVAAVAHLVKMLEAGFFGAEGGVAAAPTPLLDLAVACVVEVAEGRLNDVHKELTSLLVGVVHAYGAAGCGMHPLTLYRCLDTGFRLHFFFCRKRLYSNRLCQWAETSGRHRDVGSFQLSLVAAKREAASARESLSALLRALLGSVESEFVGVFPAGALPPTEDAITAACAGVRSIMRVFRASDMFCAGFCADMHAAATRLLSTWASSQVDAVPALAPYAAPAPSSSVVTALVALAAVAKIAGAPLACNEDGSPTRISELHTKVAMLQLCAEAMAAAGPAFKAVLPLPYVMRRVVCPAVLLNCSEARVMLPAVFRSVLGCVTGMWASFRSFLKLELGVMSHIVFLRTLQSHHALPQQKSDVLAELRSWVQVPEDLIELYLNFDNDAPYNHMRLTKQLAAALATIACRVHGDGSDAESVEDGDAEEGMHSAAVLALQREATEWLTDMVRALMDAAATVHLIPVDARTRKLSQSSNWQWDDGHQRAPKLSHHARSSSVRIRHGKMLESEEVLESGLEVCNTKGLTKGLRKLIGDMYVRDTPEDVVAFLRLCGHRLSDREIGDFLGDIGKTKDDEVWYQRIRDTYMAGLDFRGMPFDKALRYMLTRAGFFLPGEAQKISRILESFAKAFYEHNRAGGGEDDAGAGAGGRPLPAGGCGGEGGGDADAVLSAWAPNSADVVEILAFSTVMLNTDAHNASIKPERKMTKAQFVSNNRGIDDGKDLPRAVLEHLYDAVAEDEIKMKKAEAPGGGSGEAPGGEGASSFVAEMTTDVNRAVAHLNSVASARTVYRKRFSSDVVACMLEDVWPDVIRVIRHINVDTRDEVGADTPVSLLALDLLKYAVSAGLFLNMKPQVEEVCAVLSEVEARLVAPASAASRDWRQTVKGALTGSKEASDAIAAVHIRIGELSAATNQRADAQTLATIAARFRGKFRQQLEADPSRRVLFEGHLTKVCNEGRGKHKRYKFFLFTDVLVYASMGALSGKYTKHQSIPLGSITVSDAPPELAHISHAFRVDCDVKPLFLFADSREDHMAWRRLIREAVHALPTPPSDTTSPVLPTPMRTPRVAGPEEGSAHVYGGGGTEAASPVVEAPPRFPSFASPYEKGGGEEDAVASAIAAAVDGVVLEGPDATLAPVVEEGEEAPVSPQAPGDGLPAKATAVDAKAPVVAAAPPPPPSPSHSPGTSTTRSSPGLLSPVASPPVVVAPLSAAAPVAAPPPPPATRNRASTSLRSLSSRQLRGVFLRGLEHARPLLQQPAGGGGDGPHLTDVQKLQLYGYYRQATAGDQDPHVAVPEDAVEAAKARAWGLCRGLRRRDAMRSFLFLLQQVSPAWDVGAAVE